MEQGQKIRQLLCPKQRWVNDKEVNVCKGCQKIFIPLFVWKHHCRFCGCVFCGECAGNVMTGESIGYEGEKRLRHCNPCRARIEVTIKAQKNDYRRKTEFYPMDENIMMIEIQDPDNHNNNGEERKTIESIRHLINQQKLHLQHTAISLLRALAKELCEKHGLEAATWETRLIENAWKAAIETKPDIFIRKQPFNLLSEIRVVTIVAPNEAVAAACVKGLVLERNIPSKQLETHIKFPRVVTIKPSIEADSLMQSKQVRFDEMIRNEETILKSYLQPVFRLNPNIMFVQEQVSKVAFEMALERKIMVISKVKPQDLDKIQRLALIKKRIDNLLHIDKDQIAEMIGCCERVYFKTVRQGEMLLFIEHEAGIRTVLLGDITEGSNQNLKKVFDVLLRAAWNLKNERELAIRDLKLCGENKLEARLLAVKTIFMDKYSSSESFMSTQDVSISRMRFCQKKFETLTRPFQEYCKLRGRKQMLDQCGSAKWLSTKLYCGEEMSLGTFILKCALQNTTGCRRCHGQHIDRFFVDEFCISISTETYSSSSMIKLSSSIEQDEEGEHKLSHAEQFRENPLLYSSITKLIKAWRLDENQLNSKLLFMMYFKCEDCSKIIGNAKSRVGNDFLIMGLYHFLHILIQAVKKNQKSNSSLLLTDDQSGCQHQSMVRVFQCPRTLVKFSVAKLERYQLVPIILSEAMMKRLQAKDEMMVSQLYKRLLDEKNNCIESLESELARLPFFGGICGVALSFSIAGASASSHAYFDPYMRIEEAIGDVKKELSDIQQKLVKHVQEGLNDWTVMMRKFSKIDHVLKGSYLITNFIANALKKQKIEQTTQSQQQINLSLSASIDYKNYSFRKFSDLPIESQTALKTENLSITKTQNSTNGNTIKTQSLALGTSFSSFASTRLRKETSVYLQNDFDIFLRRIRKQRFLKFQGAFLYYPIGNIQDPVSLLACCLNSDQFQQQLKQSVYREEITTKLNFMRQVKTDWGPCQKMSKVYKQFFKEEFFAGDSQEIQFSIYYHKEFEELRKSQNIIFRLYVRSLYGCQSWDSSGGKSNSSFSKAHNETLVVKIINDKEFVQFQKFAPAYLRYMKQKREKGEQSYLAKIYGIYEVHIRNKVHKCVVMQNVFFGLDTITQVYDLKGSEVNRLAQPVGDKSFTGLDTNFLIDKDGSPYLFEPAIYDKTIPSLVDDANFLKEQGVIDYSLLVIESGLSLRMAIIDFMRPYHFVEKIETLYKQIKSGKDPTVIPPQQYAQRFVRSLKRYFIRSGRY